MHTHGWASPAAGPAHVTVVPHLQPLSKRKNPKLLPLRPHKANWEYTSQSSSQIPIKLQYMCTFFFFYQDVLFLRILLF